MPVYEVTTETVSIGQLRSIVQEIAELLESWKIGYLKIMYGYNCNLPVDELWRPEEIRVNELEGFLQRSERSGIFNLAAAICISKIHGKRLRFCCAINRTFTSEARIKREWRRSQNFGEIRV